MLLAPDATPVVGSDNYRKYFAGFVLAARETGVDLLRVTSFESVNTGRVSGEAALKRAARFSAATGG